MNLNYHIQVIVVYSESVFYQGKPEIECVTDTVIPTAETVRTL